MYYIYIIYIIHILMGDNRKIASYFEPNQKKNK